MYEKGARVRIDENRVGTVVHEDVVDGVETTYVLADEDLETAAADWEVGIASAEITAV
jgi:hypothetical protein